MLDLCLSPKYAEVKGKGEREGQAPSPRSSSRQIPDTSSSSFPPHFFLRTLCAEILPSSGTERKKEQKVFLYLPFPRRRRSIKTSCPFYILILFPSPSSCGLYPPTGIEFKRRERRKGKREGGREDFPIERTPGATPLKVVPLSPFFPSLVYTSYPSPFLPPSPPSPLRADFFDIKETIGRIPIEAKRGRGEKKEEKPIDKRPPTQKP